MKMLAQEQVIEIEVTKEHKKIICISETPGSMFLKC